MKIMDGFQKFIPAVSIYVILYFKINITSKEVHPMLIFLTGFLFSGLAAFAASRLAEPKQNLLLNILAVLLPLSEIWKQLLLTAGNGGSYLWWYFPFQLCSVPMYLCLLLPLLQTAWHGRIARAFYTFLQDYGLLGGVMALAEPSGLMHPYWTLTLHGFLWHFVLIFLGLFCSMRGLGGKSRRRFLSSLPLFLLCCVIATAVNVLSHPYGNADMFYISPYYPNGQVIFHQIALAAGTLPGNLLYILSIILGAAILHWLLRASSANKVNII